MLIETTKGKYGFTRKYIRNKWYEWFVVEVDEGYYMPYYLPVTHSYMKATSSAWVWYLIPIVIPLFLIKELTSHVYKETRRILNTWIKYNKLEN